nr:immunoglobulin light chain junction region [Macaca mulatta]
CQQESYWPTC